MYKRSLILFGILMGAFCLCFYELNRISKKEDLRCAANSQQSYKLKVATARGTIYDCRNVPLTNKNKKIISAVIPSVEALSALTPAVDPDELPDIYKKCSGKTPFTTKVNYPIRSPFIKNFEIPTRYSGIVPAAHLLGYLSSENHGVTGIEKIYDDYLSQKNDEICVKYDVDATGKFLPGMRESTEDRSYLSSKGVVLNIDSRIQAIAEEVANKYISRGAVIVTEVPNCEIRACCSIPSFMPQSVGNYLNDENSPLLNRALCQFNLGSIFKLITATAALENNISPDMQYNCTGYNSVEDAKFRCFNGIKHQDINLEQAIAHSCNGYFIELSKLMPYNAIYETAEKFGLGKPVVLAAGMQSADGILPSLKSLENAKTLANFSFGQGKLMASPIQISAFMNSIASGGVYSNPKLIKGVLDENMKINSDDKTIPQNVSKRVISEEIAQTLKNCMKAAVEYGTSRKGKPETCDAAAKTSTAQTGIVEKGKKIEQSWIAGMFPTESPKYCIVVLSEAGSGGGENCGPVFKEIADKMHQQTPELFVN